MSKSASTRASGRHPEGQVSKQCADAETFPVRSAKSDSDGWIRLIRRAAGKVCRGATSPEREEITQSALLRVLTTARRRPGDLRIGCGYARLVVRSVWVDEIRRRSREPAVSLPLDEDVTGTGYGHDPESNVQTLQIHRLVWSCLEEISESRREALELYLDGRSVKQCASRLGCSEKRAENLIYRGRSELRRLLQRRGVASV